MRLTVADLMTDRPITVRPECSADAAVEILSRHEVSELYVTDKVGRLLGVVPDYELLKAELSGEAHDATVEQLMSRGVPVFTPQSDAAEVARLFRDGRFHQFPVVAAGRLVGIVTRSDVVRLMAVLRRIDFPAATTSVQKAPRILASRSRSKRGSSKKPAMAACVTPAKRRSRSVAGRSGRK